MALLRWTSRVVAGRPDSSREMVAGVPTGLPERSSTTAARCPALRSTPSTPGLGALRSAVFSCSAASMRHPGTSAADRGRRRRRSKSAPVAAWAATSSSR